MAVFFTSDNYTVLYNSYVLVPKALLNCYIAALLWIRTTTLTILVYLKRDPRSSLCTLAVIWSEFAVSMGHCGRQNNLEHFCEGNYCLSSFNRDNSIFFQFFFIFAITFSFHLTVNKHRSTLKIIELFFWFHFRKDLVRRTVKYLFSVPATLSPPLTVPCKLGSNGYGSVNSLLKFPNASFPGIGLYNSIVVVRVVQISRWELLILYN